MSDKTELTIGLEETDYAFDFEENEEGSSLESVHELVDSDASSSQDSSNSSLGEQVAETIAMQQLTQAIETSAQEARAPEESASEPATEESAATEPEPREETASETTTPPKADTQELTEKPKTPQDEIQALLNELKRRLAETELVEYARQQGRLIDAEIKKLNAVGVRITEAEVRNIVQEAMQKGIEPVVYFKAYAADLLQNMLIFGEPLLSRPPLPGGEQVVQKARQVGRPTLEERFRTREGLLGLDYFVAEEIAGAFDEID